MQELRSQRRRKAEAWNRVNRLVAGLIIAALLTVLGMAFFPEIVRYNQLDAQLSRQKEALKREEALREEQRSEVNLLENEPEYVEAIARDKIGLMKEGETIVRLDGPAPAPAGGAKP